MRLMHYKPRVTISKQAMPKKKKSLDLQVSATETDCTGEIHDTRLVSACDQ